jgi:hypothetical protein
VARDEELIALLSPLFQAERQPNLLLASVRYLGGTGSSFSDFRSFVLDHRDEVLISCTPDGRRQMRLVAVRSCSPRLRSCLGRSPCSRWGASAGLCLFPDRFGYRYGSPRGGRPIVSGPVAL